MVEADIVIAPEDSSSTRSAAPTSIRTTRLTGENIDIFTGFSWREPEGNAAGS